MYYTIYKITNNINGRFYIGSHKTKDINDNYMGSGKYLKRAISKHGLENFTKDILFVFDNPTDMYLKEAEIVNEDFLAEENTYNLKVGGFGGFDFINNTLTSEDHKERGSKGWHSTLETIQSKYGVRHLSQIPAVREKISQRRKGKVIYNRKGLPHTEETKAKMRISAIGKQVGNKNSQFGTCWVYHELIGSRKILKELLPLYIDQGWIKGRVIKL